MRQVLRLFALAMLALLAALVPTASASHDHTHWFSGEWHMVFPDEPKEGPLRLHGVVESVMRQELAIEGYRFGSWLDGKCTHNAKTQWYIGSAQRGADKGPIVACTNSGSGLIYAIFKSLYKVEVAISWPRGTSALATSFNLPNGPVAHWHISFVGHFRGDGSQIKEPVARFSFWQKGEDQYPGRVLPDVTRTTGSGKVYEDGSATGTIHHVDERIVRADLVLDLKVLSGRPQEQGSFRQLHIIVSVVRSSVRSCPVGTRGEIFLEDGPLTEFTEGLPPKFKPGQFDKVAGFLVCNHRHAWENSFDTPAAVRVVLKGSAYS